MKKLVHTHWFTFNENKLQIFIFLSLVTLLCAFYSVNPASKQDVYYIFIGCYMGDMALRFSFGVIHHRLQQHVPVARVSNFFHRLPYTKKEIFILILTEKFYTYIPFSLAYTYGALLLYKDKNLSLIPLFLSFMLISISHNFQFYRLSVFANVDAPRASKIYQMGLGFGRGVLLVFYPAFILVLGLSITASTNNALYFLVISLLSLIIQIALHFLIVENYERKGRTFIYQFIGQFIPSSISLVYAVATIAFVVSVFVSIK